MDERQRDTDVGDYTAFWCTTCVYNLPASLAPSGWCPPTPPGGGAKCGKEVIHTSGAPKGSIIADVCIALALIHNT